MGYTVDVTKLKFKPSQETPELEITCFGATMDFKV
jgi:hypothetical protein